MSLQFNSDLIYLDYAASTPVDVDIRNAMGSWLERYYGNPSNFGHAAGAAAWHALEGARTDLAGLLGVQADEVVFTSGATESNNLLLRGLVEHPLQTRRKIVVGATEHASILTTAQELAQNLGAQLGYTFCTLPVDANGQICLQSAQSLIDDQTLCVCLMDVNNETGIVQQNLQAVVKRAHQVGALVHVDAAQGFARHGLFAQGVDYDTAVIASGKIYGPRGAAALIVRKRRPRILIAPQLTGGHQESGLRAGTPCVPTILGFVRACLLQRLQAVQRFALYAELEKVFVDELQARTEVLFYGLETTKVSGILSLCLPNVNAMKLLENTPRVCASVGSACKTLQATASHVLMSMGVPLEQALSSFRVSFGIGNTKEEMIEAARELAQQAEQLRKSALWI